SAAPDTQQFISFLTRECFVVEPASATKPRLKSQLNSQAKPQVKSELDPELDAKPSKGASSAKAVRRPTAQLPWPLSGFADYRPHPLRHPVAWLRGPSRAESWPPRPSCNRVRRAPPPCARQARAWGGQAHTACATGRRPD